MQYTTWEEGLEEAIRILICGVRKRRIALVRLKDDAYLPLSLICQLTY
jgi:hypothetical protein